jgi:predicted DNA-binding transcriptional regulator YafY
MNATDRRTEIMNILIVRRHTTARELAEELGVTIRTIQRDIQALSPGFPVYTRQGWDGGIFIGDDYKPYVNTLSADELKTLREIYGQAEGAQKKILLQIIHKYGPDKLEL